MLVLSGKLRDWDRVLTKVVHNGRHATVLDVRTGRRLTFIVQGSHLILTITTKLLH